MEPPTHTDTLSGRFHGQWAFLSNPPPPLHHAQARSLPPSSSYLRSDQGSVSPRPAAITFHHLNASRSSLSRNNRTASVGGRSYSSATAPSQPVLLRINSADASRHLSPVPRRARPRSSIMSQEGKLPSLSAFSFEGILDAIQEDIEDDMNGIAEILGRSRLVLADQYDSQLPPTGEIRASALQAVMEASSSNERLAANEDGGTFNENASLLEGSQTVSAAYGLLERLQSIPRPRRIMSELPTPPTRPRLSNTDLRNSSPAILTDPILFPSYEQLSPSPTPSQLATARPSLDLLRAVSSPDTTSIARNPTTAAVVSEVYLSAGADGRLVSDPPVVSEAGKHYPLYSYDESALFDDRTSSHVSAQRAMHSTSTTSLGFADRVHGLLMLRNLRDVLTWREDRNQGVGEDGQAFSRPQRSARWDAEGASMAEAQLRDILGRHAPAGNSILRNDAQRDNERMVAERHSHA
jgi:hypothetical protein